MSLMHSNHDRASDAAVCEQSRFERASRLGRDRVEYPVAADGLVQHRNAVGLRCAKPGAAIGPALRLVVVEPRPSGVSESPRCPAPNVAG